MRTTGQPEAEAYGQFVLDELEGASLSPDGVVGVYVAEEVVPDERKTTAVSEATAKIVGVSVIRKEVCLIFNARTWLLT